jgi:hypothetical protein
MVFLYVAFLKGMEKSESFVNNRMQCASDGRFIIYLSFLYCYLL